MLQQDRDHLQERYRDDRLIALALDKNRIWVHWAEGPAVETIALRQFPSDWKAAPRRLRICDGSKVARMTTCSADYGTAFLEVLMPGAQVRVEYGIELSGAFLPLYETQLRMPGATGRAASRAERPDCISSYSIYRVT
ncbi:hypothetical protein CIG75_05705 [Tumebacillus algifaecis]|uniref:Uncharacterized protein n=1 Tax=Tumebacillus algifaecis TaxID=1214604 RepID=A0A223CYW9_9BACL|nr:hypothetical protein [Tumebacillus algifaecis]ASS74542.1 hypothetical protein CIG75_05705 [Tumebacillus algifaecis]